MVWKETDRMKHWRIQNATNVRLHKIPIEKRKIWVWRGITVAESGYHLRESA